MCILLGRYDRAIQLLKGQEFHNWEGEGEIHDVYMDAYALKGEREFRRGKYQDALQDYKTALTYPENLEVGQPYRQPRLPQVDYLMGLAQQKLGSTTESKQLFGQAIASQGREEPEMEYYQGLAALELGQNAKAKRFFINLIARGERTLAGSSKDTLFAAKFGRRRSPRYVRANAHYLIALGNLGEGDTAKARGELQQAL